MSDPVEERVEILSREMDALRIQLRAQAEQIGQNVGTPPPVNSEQKPMVVFSSTKLEKFRDKPQKATDPTIREWVADIRSHSKSRKLSQTDFATFICDHLTGKARLEIQGRGDNVKNNPEEILRILQRVFGDGDELPALQQRFFSHSQGTEDLVTCSLNLVELYDRIVELDDSFKACRESALKGRFAECVSDEGLRRELRRLNLELPSLSFFDLRDRAVRWLGVSSGKSNIKVAVSHETGAESESLLKRQEEMIAKQQKQIEDLLASVEKINNKNTCSYEKTETGVRRCWNCNSTKHLKLHCPFPKKSFHEKPPTTRPLNE